MTVSTNFDKLCERLARAEIDFSSGSFKFLLVSAAPTAANLAAWTVRSDVVSECPSSGTYTNGVGGSVTAAVALDTANHWATVTFGSPTAFTSATLSAVGAIIYQVIGSAATDKLITYVDFGGTVSSTSGTFATTFNTPLKITR
jgi:hypothetical protein